MKTVKTLIEERQQLIHQQKDLYNRAKSEERSLTNDELDQFEKMESDAADLRRQIDAAKAIARNHEEEFNAQEQRQEAKPEYKDVFLRAMVKGMDTLTREERDLMLQNRGTDPQQAGSNALGGYTVPEGFSNELFTEMAAWGGMLEAARIYQTSTGNPLPWPTMDDTSNSGGILGETATDTVSDVAFGQKTLNAYTYTSNIIKASVEFLQDSAFNLDSWLTPVAGRRIGVAANAHFTTGTGSSQPNGVVTAAGAGVTAASATAITRNELVDLIHSVNKAYRRNGRFMFNDSTLSAIKKLAFGSSDARPLWQPSIREGEPDRLEGYAYTVNYDMASIATGNVSVLFGDFSKYIIRQVGSPVMVRLNERYMDALHVGFIMYQRLDGELLSANAIKKLTQA